MQAFDETYLCCEMRVGLVPGPLHIEPPYTSQEVHDIALYPATDVLATFGSLAGTHLVCKGGTDASDEWCKWAWRWTAQDRYIDIDFTVFETDPVITWGGSNLTTHCTFADLVHLWLQVKTRHPAVWLHTDDTTLWSPHSFLAQFAVPALHPALMSADQGVRERADQVLSDYRALGDHGGESD